MRLIDADKLMETIYERIDQAFNEDKTQLAGKLWEIKKLVELQLTVDAEPTLYGRWVHNNTYMGEGVIYNCSICGEPLHVEYDDDLEHCSYCRCGAKMKGEK